MGLKLLLKRNLAAIKGVSKSSQEKRASHKGGRSEVTPNDLGKARERSENRSLIEMEYSSSQTRASTQAIDLFWSVRSPFCYLAIARLRELGRRHQINLRPVLPLALRSPVVHDPKNHVKHQYNYMDAARVADMLGYPFSRPDPDPLTPDPATNEARAIALTGRCVVAHRFGCGLQYVEALSNLLFAQSADWIHDLDQVTIACGLNPALFDEYTNEHLSDISAEIENNQQALGSSGHWGVPLMVFNGEPFFGQDRIDLLAWRLDRTLGNTSN
ncbi:2-hydroxychromene-2-carboxylate isomerase [Ruegeria jejuensis]|uniref:2-hydroxychromene-2-carboxylate isomerase n=1 Tax=Ruegeria jejuensis TaxID=3233338 RepID=UPI00355BE1CA